MYPQTWLQVAIVVAGVVPGFVYQISRRRLRGPGPDEEQVSIRVLRSIATSAIFASLYGIFLGNVLSDALSAAGRGHGDPSLLSAFGLFLVLVVPWIAARLIYYVSTSQPWLTSASWLATKLRLRRQWDPTPSAWDFAFSHREAGFVRVLTPDGAWIGGYFGPDSFATSYPEDREIYIEVGYAMDDTGKFTDTISAPDGIYVRCDDARLVDFLPAADDRIDNPAQTGNEEFDREEQEHGSQDS